MATASTAGVMANSAADAPMTRGEKKVIFASSLGTVFEWYDFYLYGSLAGIIAKQFFTGWTRPRAISSRCWRSRPASWCGRSGPWCSGASAT